MENSHNLAEQAKTSSKDGNMVSYITVIQLICELSSATLLSHVLRLIFL